MAGTEVAGEDSSRRGGGARRRRASPFPFSGSRGAAGVWLLALVTAAALLALGLLVARARRLTSERTASSRAWAERLAVAKYEELSRLPPGAPELRLPPGVLESTHEDAEETPLPASPGFDPPRLSVSWTVRSEEAGLLRVTVVVRDGERAARLRPPLARLAFLLRGAGA